MLVEFEPGPLTAPDAEPGTCPPLHLVPGQVAPKRSARHLANHPGLYKRLIFSVDFYSAASPPHPRGACCGCTFKNNLHFTTRITLRALANLTRSASALHQHHTGTGIAMAPRTEVPEHGSSAAGGAEGRAWNAEHGLFGRTKAAEDELPAYDNPATKSGCFEVRCRRSVVAPAS